MKCTCKPANLDLQCPEHAPAGSGDGSPRFATTSTAREYAKRESIRHPGAQFFITESRAGEMKPYVVDRESFVRSWERRIATYRNGKVVTL